MACPEITPAIEAEPLPQRHGALERALPSLPHPGYDSIVELQSLDRLDKGLAVSRDLARVDSGLHLVEQPAELGRIHAVSVAPSERGLRVLYGREGEGPGAVDEGVVRPSLNGGGGVTR